ncbi:Lysine-specific demethylase 7A [Apodemus speciosus]|uniref:Lysine-specific demethylase 7A n=1 Tax=Apodemus speciosus TaxID=105296 RepID=A0ABQ0EUI9_APOSI
MPAAVRREPLHDRVRCLQGLVPRQTGYATLTGLKLNKQTRLISGLGGCCVGVEEHHAADIDVYHCPSCAALHGSSLMKKRRNWHRHDYTEADDGSKPVQAGTRAFVTQLRSRNFPSADDIIVKMHGSQLTQRYLEKHGFDAPIMVPKLDDLGLRLPSPAFSVMDVERHVGGDKVIDVIDVARQADSKMTLHNYVKYFMNPNRPKVLNVISLEFSDTKMSELVEVPDIARKLSWVENYWPDDSVFPKPFVQKYCLMGVQDSYTDFHIDFGGTSVWYHVLWGEKIFYLIKPTNENLALYESWSSSVTQSEVFFGDKVDKCYKCVVKQGHTLFVPTGWIHAVLTSQDCMAFGGNFLHNLNIGMQLRCYEMEKRLKTPDLFKFPFFEAICWFVAKSLLETLKELKEDGFQPQTYLVQGVKALHTALKLWMKKELYQLKSQNLAIKGNEESQQDLGVDEASAVQACNSSVSGTNGEAEGNPTNLCSDLHTWVSLCSPGCPGTHCVDQAGLKLRNPPASASQVLGLKACATTARQWLLVSEHAFEIPDNVRPGHLIKELSKVIRAIEISRPSNEASPPYHSRRKMRKLRDHNVRTPSNLDILELHTREVLKRLEMCPWEEGLIDERQLFADRSLYTADSENEEDKKPTKKANMKTEQSSGREEAESEGSPKPLSRIFTSVKSELRSRPSEYSDVSDSEDSGPDCTALKINFATEDSESSGDEKKHEITSNSKEESDIVRNLLQKSQKPSRNEIPVKRERPSSTGAEEDAVQGMLAMAGLHYSTCLQRQLQSTDCSAEKNSLQDPSSCHSRNPEFRQLYRCSKPVEFGYHAKTEDQDLMTSSWNKQFDRTSRFNAQLGPDHHEGWGLFRALAIEVDGLSLILETHMVEGENQLDLSRSQKYIKKESSSEISQKAQSRHCVDSNNSSIQNGKYMLNPSLVSCQISNGNLSPERPIGETSFSVPLHPTKRPASNPPPISNQATKGKRPKKGMATAKQRLGKILKLNRNGHARFFV